MFSEMKFQLLFVCVVMLLVRYGSDAFSTGPPSRACRTMMPSHRSEARTDPSPYVITFNRQSSRRNVDGNKPRVSFGIVNKCSMVLGTLP